MATADGSDGTDPDAVGTHEVVSSFHRLYWESAERTWHQTRWLGVAAAKCPLDLWIYQEILHRTRPDLIVESGTAGGGSAYFLASICDLIGEGRVITIDIKERPRRPQHPRITYLTGSSVDPDIVASVRNQTAPGSSVMVILDSDHRRDHVLEELRAYGPLVGEGQYMIVEDTNVNGHPVLAEFGPGPMEAVEQFLAEQGDFVVDGDQEKFFMTFNPRGYLLKTGARR